MNPIISLLHRVELYFIYRFAELTATVFLTANIRVNLFSDVIPTPFIPFGIKLLKAAAGVMVTASHNPKDDNGYKVYWSNSAQVISDIYTGDPSKTLW